MIKKASLLLYGSSENYEQYKKNLDNFLSSYQNEYSFDIFIYSNFKNNNHINNILKFYKPISSIFINEHINNNILLGLNLIINYIDNTNIKYEFVTIINFETYFNSFSTDIKKFNFKLLEKSNFIENNFFLFPTEYLFKFYDIINNKLTIDDIPDNFICNILDSNFYSLAYFNNVELIINKLDLTDNSYYYSINNSTKIKTLDILIDPNKNYIAIKNINFIKLKKKVADFSWFGFKLEKIGNYRLCFKINSNKDIKNFNFIKLHKPTKYYKINPIYSNDEVLINTIIETTNNDDLLCLIFDLYKDDILINYSDFVLEYLDDNIISNNSEKIYYDYKLKIDDNIIQIYKKKTKILKIYKLAKYVCTPNKVKNKIEFDIIFKSDVIPNDSLYFTIGPHQYFIKNNHISIDVFLPKEENQFILYLENFLDELHFEIHNFNISESDMNYKFISFYSMGKPIDEANNLIEAKDIYYQKIHKFFDEIKFYNTMELLSDPETEFLVKKFPIEPIYNKKTNLIGYLRWKPYIILDSLKKMNDNDILCYRDCNVLKYPMILDDIDQIILTINLVLVNMDIYLPVERFPDIRMKNHIKKEVFDFFNLYKENILEDYLFNASIIVCRKNNKTIAFWENCLEICKDDQLISCTTNVEQHKDYKWNTQEQSIINLCYYEYLQENCKYTGIYERYAFPDYTRTFSYKLLKKIPKVAILLAGQMRNFNNQNLLDLNSKYLFDIFNCDIFISTWEKKGYSPYHGEINDKSYMNNNITIDDLSVYKNVKNAVIEDFDLWFDNLPDNFKELYNEGFSVNNKKILATAFPQLYKIWSANQLKKKYEKDKNFKYDIVIRYRPDMCLVEEINKKYLDDFFNNNSKNKIWTLNPPKIFFPNRIYDIFFFGDSMSMDILCDSWLNIIDLINYDYDNGLPNVDCNRLLYITCLVNKLKVIEIPRCIGDIYRDENINDYINKIKKIYN